MSKYVIKNLQCVEFFLKKERKKKNWNIFFAL